MIRRTTALLAVLAGATLLAAAAGRAQTFVFGRPQLGKLPAKWEAARTGKGEGSVWKVVADKTAPSKTGYVLAQTAAGPGPLFNLCVPEEPRFRDVELSVALKAVRGEIDQGGGLVWRYQDADNYYITRFNPLEENFRLYKVIGGRRLQLATKNVPGKAGEWHNLRVVHQGDRIQCYLNDKLYLEATDDAIQKEGKVGLWTKADAQTHFDMLHVREPRK